MRMFVEDLHSSTVAQLEANKMTNGDSAWYYRCVPQYMERDSFTPGGQETEDGFLRVVGRRVSQCMETPGTTRISLPGSKLKKMLFDSQECSKDSGGTKNGCYVETEAVKTPALRVLLPDRDWKSIRLAQSEIQTLEGRQHHFFLQLRLLYSVFAPTLDESRVIMKKNNRRIVHTHTPSIWI
jgi:hypothetical protein